MSCDSVRRHHGPDMRSCVIGLLREDMIQASGRRRCSDKLFKTNARIRARLSLTCPTTMRTREWTHVILPLRYPISYTFPLSPVCRSQNPAQAQTRAPNAVTPRQVHWEMPKCIIQAPIETQHRHIHHLLHMTGATHLDSSHTYPDHLVTRPCPRAGSTSPFSAAS